MDQHTAFHLSHCSRLFLCTDNHFICLGTTDSRDLQSIVQISLGDPSKDRQRFVDAVVLISAPDGSVRLPNFENVVETAFECGLRTLNDARLCQTEMNYSLLN